MKLTSDGTELFYDIRGKGPPLVLLHPFPLNHDFWAESAAFLEQRYRLILPDLRGHGESPAGEGVATMGKQARDILRLCDELQVSKAIFAGVSIGGYILFELWRQSRERITAMILANTRASAETPAGRANRQKAIELVQQRGPAPFIEEMLPKLLARTTLETRQDLVSGARGMMARMNVAGIVAVQQGMMERPDSIPTLKTINVPTLIVAGEEDGATPLAEAEVMRQHIAGSRLEVIPRAGHYAIFEQPEYAGRLMRGFVDGLK
jgi:3-oxoadipate enol-lactonase